MSGANAGATLLQIIHTNDLHSHFEQADVATEGGYAAVKAQIDRLKAQAREAGIDTLTLDAGDFSEGSEFFLADQGTRSWRLMQSMGYDAIEIGNHDWLIGVPELDRLIGWVNPTVPLLGANLKFNQKYREVSTVIKPYVEVERAGARIAILGLATNELVYRWRVSEGGSKDGNIENPAHAAAALVPALRKRDDFVLALTHLGIDADRALVEHVKGIDLVVGGHSHTALQEPAFSRSPAGAEIPIVQAGAHGQFVGDLLVDLEAGKPLRIVHYRLVPVRADGPQDAAISADVKDARAELEKKYGSQWLYEPLAYSEGPLERPFDHPTRWGTLYAEAIQEAVHAELALDIGEFYGETLPAGTVTRERLIQFYPRTFDVTKPLGWSVWTTEVPGWLLELLLVKKLAGSQFFNSAGVSIVHGRISIAGRPLDLARHYRVAVTEGIGRGSKEMKAILKAFLRPVDSGIPVWSAVELKLQKLGGVVLSH